MAAYLNRGMSMISPTSNGNPSTASSNGYDSLIDANARQLHNVNSPLQIFVKAKKKINDIFVDINDYVVETTQFIEGEFVIALLVDDLILYLPF